MTSFFKSLGEIDQLSPTDIAQEFAKYCFKHIAEIKEATHSEGDVVNVAIVDNTTPLSFMTTRSLLVSNTTVLGHHNTSLPPEYRSTDLQNNPYAQRFESDFISTVDIGMKTRHLYQAVSRFILCPDLLQLGEWLRACRPLLLEGDVFYLPNIRVDPNYDAEPYNTGSFQCRAAERHIVSAHMWDVLIKNKTVLEDLQNPQYSINKRLLKPILSLELPIIENIDLETFSRITVDEKETFIAFRDFLQLKLLELIDIQQSETFYKDLKRFSIEVRDGVRGLNTQMRNLKRKAAFQATEAVVGAFTAVLICINTMNIDSLATLGGSGSGIWLVSRVIEQYVAKRKELEGSPYFYLWLLSRSRIAK
jgi:hypothetical protein